MPEPGAVPAAARSAAGVRVYRAVTLALAAGYTLYRLGLGDWSGFGGPLRYLTIWALLLSLASAALMLARSHGLTRHGGDTVAMTAAVFNVMVVYLYWKLFLTDPALVNGGTIVWHQEYYLHALGPALQLIDALFLGRVFRRIWRGALALCLLVSAYVWWAEAFVQRYNDAPVGSVTSGLPYPFLNAMAWEARQGFYLMYGVVALGLLVSLSGLGLLIRRLRPVAPARAEAH